MNEHELLEALGEVSEEAIEKYALPKEERRPAAGKERITMKKNDKKDTAKKTTRISKAGIAAAVAVCVGLNAAFFFGIRKMKQDAAEITPASPAAPIFEEPDHPYITVVEATSTLISIQMKNPTEEEFAFNPEFAIFDGDRIIPATYDSYQVKSPLVAKQKEYLCFNYEPLDDGTYQFVNLNEDGSMSDRFEPVEFTIPTKWTAPEVTEDDISSVPDTNGSEWDGPNLIGMDYDDAVKMYGDVLQINVDSREYSDYEAGRIFDQDALPNTLLKKGDTVNVKVSLGKRKVQLPDVTGWDFETAKSTILGLGLMVDKRNVYSSEVEKDKIISTDPEGPIEVEPGTYIRVTVSMGENGGGIPVPDFVGISIENAKTIADGLKINLEITPIDSDEPAGTIISQSIKPGEKLAEDTTITVHVSTPMTEIQIFTPACKIGTYELTVEDSGGNILDTTTLVVQEEGLGGKPKFTLPLPEEENKEIHIYVTNKETGARETIGSYMLHSNTRDYETIAEDVEAAFRQIGAL